MGQIIFIKDIFAFIIGCCFGSFINVVIHRLPIGESIIIPGSRCIKCGYKIRWFENIPLISWLILRGKCKNCTKKISLSYPLIELISGLLFVLNNYSSPSIFSLDSTLTSIIFGWFFITTLLTIAIFDIKFFWIPNSICQLGISSGIISSIIFSIIYYDSVKFLLIFECLTSAFLGYAIFQFIIAIGFKIFKKPVMGQGDAKLSGLIGSWLGVKGLMITIWLAFNLAGIFVIIGLIAKKIQRNQKIPFGAFLAFSAIYVWQFGNSIFSNLTYLGT